MRFEWDSNKADSNASKHDVTFDEATTLFGSALSLTFDDPDSSVGESRFITFGISSKGNHLAVVHTDRDDTIRVISARKMTRNEVKFHEQF